MFRVVHDVIFREEKIVKGDKKNGCANSKQKKKEKQKNQNVLNADHCDQCGRSVGMSVRLNPSGNKRGMGYFAATPAEKHLWKEVFLVVFDARLAGEGSKRYIRPVCVKTTRPNQQTSVEFLS